MNLLGIWTRIMQVMLVGMAFLITGGALMRYLFNSPLDFVDEMSGFLLLAITFLGLAYVERGGGHINIDMVFNLFPARVKAGLTKVNWIIEVIWAIILLTCASLAVLDYYETQKRSMSTDWLLYPFASIMILGTVMLMIELFLKKRSLLSHDRGQRQSAPGAAEKEMEKK